MIFPDLLTLAFSPCPNDTFIFDALVNGKIDTGGLKFEVVMEDVETLNGKAIAAEYDITKISFAAFSKVINNYVLSDSGSALGRGTGPLVISKNFIPHISNDLAVAIPGENTTADFLFSIFFPHATKKIAMVFSGIEEAVLSGQVDLGVIIHENRFTYKAKGLTEVCDLGRMWEEKTNQPVPLGGIAIKRTLSQELIEQINMLIRESVRYAFANPTSSKEFVKQHSQEMNDDVIRKHIDLYVNDYTFELGEEGRLAIRTLLQEAINRNIIPVIPENIFLKSGRAISVQ